MKLVFSTFLGLYGPRALQTRAGTKLYQRPPHYKIGIRNINAIQLTVKTPKPTFFLKELLISLPAATAELKTLQSTFTSLTIDSVGLSLVNTVRGFSAFITHRYTGAYPTQRTNENQIMSTILFSCNVNANTLFVSF